MKPLARVGKLFLVLVSVICLSAHPAYAETHIHTLDTRTVVVKKAWYERGITKEAYDEIKYFQPIIYHNNNHEYTGWALTDYEYTEDSVCVYWVCYDKALFEEHGDYGDDYGLVDVSKAIEYGAEIHSKIYSINDYKEQYEKYLAGCEKFGDSPQAINVWVGNYAPFTTKYEGLIPDWQLEQAAKDFPNWEPAFAITQGYSVLGQQEVTFHHDAEYGEIHHDAITHTELYCTVCDEVVSSNKCYFIDVTSSTDHADDINWMWESGISKGWEVGTNTYEYRPYNDIARADMAAFLYRLAGSPDYTPSDSIKSYFSDVSESTPHYKEVLWLAEMGISKGWTVGFTHEFRPYETIKRCDMAAFLQRLSNKLGKGSSVTPAASSKVADLGTNHTNAILWLVGSGVSAGWDNGNGTCNYKPMETVKRCDMAAFLHRMSVKGLV